MSEPAPSLRSKGRFRKFLLYFLLILMLAGTGYYFICGITYSDGTRSGVLTKVSRKGFLFKTYEGEMNIGGLNQGDGTILPATIFKFSVTDETVYYELEELQGTKVVVRYRQVLKNLFWQGETDYFITDVKPVTRL